VCVCARERVCAKHLFTHTLTVTVRDTLSNSVLHTLCVCERENFKDKAKESVERQRNLRQNEKERERDSDRK